MEARIFENEVDQSGRYFSIGYIIDNIYSLSWEKVLECFSRGV